MKGGIPRKGLIAHWQNSDVSSQIFVVSTFLSTLALVGAFSEVKNRIFRIVVSLRVEVLFSYCENFLPP